MCVSWLQPAYCVFAIDNVAHSQAFRPEFGVRSSGRQNNWATANWATHFGQLGDNIGRVIKYVNVGKLFEIISF